MVPLRQKSIFAFEEADPEYRVGDLVVVLDKTWVGGSSLQSHVGAMRSRFGITSPVRVINQIDEHTERGKCYRCWPFRSSADMGDFFREQDFRYADPDEVIELLRQIDRYVRGEHHTASLDLSWGRQ